VSATAQLDEVETALEHYGALVRSEMQRFLPDGEPAYLYDLVRDYPARGGKAVRPALLLATCQAFGGSPREGIGAAVALEMLHNAFLIHDDVQDSSEQRRGAPTLHRLYGVPLAINAGDALAILALRPVLDHRRVGARVARRIVDEVLETIQQTAEGQALELGWRRDNVVDLRPEDYFTLVAKKTCWYTTVAPLRLGALVGSRGAASLTALARFGFFLGAAFQIRDDLLNLLDTRGVGGKDAFGDIREGKRTLMLLHVLGAASAADRAWLVRYLGSEESDRSPAAVIRVRRLMVLHGSLEAAREHADRMAEAAAASFDEAFAEVADSRHLAFVRGLVPYMLARSR
jgi:geranylgeranyl diphosphate synthase type II